MPVTTTSLMVVDASSRMTSISLREALRSSVYMPMYENTSWLSGVTASMENRP